MASSFTTYNTSIREEGYRKYRTKRLQEAFIFLKTIPFDGDYDSAEEDLFLGEGLIEETSSPRNQDNSLLESDPSLSALINNARESHKRNQLNSFSTVSASEDVRQQKVHFGEGEIGMGKSKSTIFNLKELAKQLIHVSSTYSKQTSRHLTGKRVILVTPHHIPFQLFSIIPYETREPARSLSITNSAVSIGTYNYIDDIDLGDCKKEVSYSHLLNSTIRPRKRFHSDTEHEQYESADYQIDMDQVLDDPELTSGKHRTVLNLPSYMVSIVQYAKPSKVKKDINERFKEKFPLVTITLTKLRSIKAELLIIGNKMSLDLAIVSCAFVYFEKTILKTRITKQNRKYIAGACLLLSIKFSDDCESKNIKAIIEAITDQFRLSHKDLLSCELQVLILMEFSLLLLINESLPIYKRLEASLS